MATRYSKRHQARNLASKRFSRSGQHQDRKSKLDKKQLLDRLKEDEDSGEDTFSDFMFEANEVDTETHSNQE